VPSHPIGSADIEMKQRRTVQGKGAESHGDQTSKPDANEMIKRLGDTMKKQQLEGQ